METNRILVAVDLTESSEHAVAFALQLAKKLGASIDFAHIATLPPPTPGEAMSVAFDPLTTEPAKKLMKTFEGRAAAAGLIGQSHVAIGATVFGLLDMIREVEPTLVVLGSHGKSPITRALVGSVTEGLMRRSPVPVLMVPSPQRSDAAERTAWSCRDCGHILDSGESKERCAQCDANPTSWISAPMSSEPIDFGVPATGETDREVVESPQANSASGISIAPAGVEGYETNAELRVRY